MISQTITKRFASSSLAIVGFACLATALSPACGDQGSASESASGAQTVEASKLAILAAGDASRELDVEAWQFEQHLGLVRGVDASGVTVAEFRVDPERHTVEDLTSNAPAVGEHKIMSEASLSYWMAFRSDVASAATEAATSAPGGETNVLAEWQSCWGQDLLACQSYGVWLMQQGHITSFICGITDWCGGMIGLAF